MDVDYRFIYPLIASLLLGLWSVFHKLASKDTPVLLGAAIIALTSALVGMVSIIALNIPLSLSRTSFYVLLLAGIVVLMIDALVIKAYSTSLPYFVVNTMLIALSLVVSYVIGYVVFKEHISYLNVVGLALIVIGVYLVSINY